MKRIVYSFDKTLACIEVALVVALPSALIFNSLGLKASASEVSDKPVLMAYCALGLLLAFYGGFNFIRHFSKEADPKLQLLTEISALSARWRAYIAIEQWQHALEMADAIIEMDADNPIGWLHRSYAIRRLHGISEARDTLLHASKLFPNNINVLYNLACYDCQLGDRERALVLLKRTFALGAGMELKVEAMNDPDLEPLWKEISSI